VGAYPRHVPQQPVRLLPGGEQDQGAPGGGDPVQGPAPAAVQPGAKTAVPRRARPGVHQPAAGAVRGGAQAALRDQPQEGARQGQQEDPQEGLRHRRLQARGGGGQEEHQEPEDCVRLDLSIGAMFSGIRRDRHREQDLQICCSQKDV